MTKTIQSFLMMSATILVLSMLEFRAADADAIVEVSISDFLSKHQDKVRLRARGDLSELIQKSVSAVLEKEGLKDDIGRIEIDVTDLRLARSRHSVLRSFNSRMLGKMRLYGLNGEMIEESDVEAHGDVSGSSRGHWATRNQYADGLVARFAFIIADTIRRSRAL